MLELCATTLRYLELEKLKNLETLASLSKRVRLRGCGLFELRDLTIGDAYAAEQRAALFEALPGTRIRLRQHATTDESTFGWRSLLDYADHDRGVHSNVDTR